MSNTLKFGNGQWATKKSSTLAYNDENGNFKPLPFNFTRSTGATRVNKQGLIEVVSNNEPRIDFNDDSKGALLLEPQRTNLVTYSEDFSNASWFKGGLTVIANQAISPDGSQNADEITPDATTGAIRIWQTETTSATTYSLSFFVKYNGKQYVQLLFGSLLNSVDFSNFDLINGTVTLGAGEIESFGNGWYKISLTASLNAATDQVYLWSIDSATSSRGASSTGNGSDGYFVWGAQLEQGSYPTSYIPTQSATATRVAENAENLNVSVLPTSYPFTIFTEAKYSSVLEFFPVSFLDNSVSFRYFAIRFKNGKIESLNRPNSEIILTSSSTYTEGQNVSVALKVESTSTKLFVNGVLEASATNTLLFDSSINDLFIGKLRSVSDTGTRIGINSLKIYNTALTDQELINLTTI